jgi:hypothetical protein
MSRATLGYLLLTCALAGCGAPASGGPADGGKAEGGQSRATSVSVRVDPQGHYFVIFSNPAFTFAGSLGSAAASIKEQSGADAVGKYHEVTFTSASPVAQTDGIRAYDSLPAVVFTVTYPAGATNPVAPFPTFDTQPQLPYHITYSDSAPFAPVTFDVLTPDSPFVFFDGNANAFILSAATNFLNASTVMSSAGAISSGIDPAIKTLPAGFSHKTILVAQQGITAAHATWGGALLSMSGKTRAPNDATPELERFGYWTDSGAHYYFRFDKTLGYPGTLIAVRDYFKKVELPIAYMQLDAWWYPKGPTQAWNHNVGMYLYEADATLFPKGLSAFQKDIALPLITHANWISPSSPYVGEYKMSNSVSIDPAFWKDIAGYISAGGVSIYEQDFLNENALPITTNLTDQDAYLDTMAAAMAARGISMQYCMPLPRQYLQATKYPNLLTTRVSADRFERPRYQDFLYTSLLTSSLGAWPWTDVFFSVETDNVLMSTLSAGLFGVGDEIGKASLTNLRQVMRPDGVIVKPDMPIVPLDETFINNAKGVDTPLVGATFTDFGKLRASYVYAFNMGTSVSASFSPAMLGYSAPVYVWNYFQNTGALVEASATYTQDLGASSASSYYVVAPLGPSGIALIGDRGKFASLGKKRFAKLTDDGTLSASLVFASGEGPVTLHGYAASSPTVKATTGSVGPVHYDGATKLFTVQVTPENAAAVITMH